MKNRVVWKFFGIWQWEEEEAWLNGMSAKGWHLISVKFCRYEFEQGAPGAYQYRLEALEDGNPGSAKTQEYLSFMRDTGAEYVGHMLYWAYFRKAADGEPFEVFSDIDSRLRHMERFEKIPLCVMPLLLINLFNAYNMMFNLDAPVWAGVILALTLVLLAVLLYGSHRLHEKRRELEAERQLHE